MKQMVDLWVVVVVLHHFRVVIMLCYPQHGVDLQPLCTVHLTIHLQARLAPPALQRISLLLGQTEVISVPGSVWSGSDCLLFHWGMLVHNRSQWVVVIDDCGGSIAGWWQCLHCIAEVLANQGHVDEFEMPPKTVLPEGRGTLEPEITCDSEVSRDAEVIKGNMRQTPASLEPEIMRSSVWRRRCVATVTCWVRLHALRQSKKVPASWQLASSTCTFKSPASRRLGWSVERRSTTFVNSIMKSVKLWAFFLLEGGRCTTTRRTDDVRCVVYECARRLKRLRGLIVLLATLIYSSFIQHCFVDYICEKRIQPPPPSFRRN